MPSESEIPSNPNRYKFMLEMSEAAHDTLVLACRESDEQEIEFIRRALSLRINLLGVIDMLGSSEAVATFNVVDPKTGKGFAASFSDLGLKGDIQVVSYEVEED